jgi:DNA repair exonuclease SbcCD nuclease subunit
MSGEAGDQDVALKVVHTADWHLGARFVSFDEPARTTLTRARLEAIDRVLDTTERSRADALLCAGDLFDVPKPEREWWEGLASKLAKRKWSGRHVFLLPGNHDPLVEGSPYHPAHPFRGLLPPWVHVVDRDDYSFELGPDAVLYACPCRTQAGEMDLAMRLPERAPGDARIRIGMVHGQTFNIPGHQMNFPIAPDAALSRGLEYLAIGDTLAHEDVGTGIPTVYPSTPEQLNFGEKDTGYVAVVLFRRHGRPPLIQKERVAYWTWRTETLRDLPSLRALRDETELRRTVLRLILELYATPAEYAEVEAILDELAGTAASRGRVGVMQLDREGLLLDTREVEQVFEDLPAVVRAAVRRLKEEEAEGPNPEVARRALYHLYRLSRGAT